MAVGPLAFPLRQAINAGDPVAARAAVHATTPPGLAARAALLAPTDPTAVRNACTALTPLPGPSAALFRASHCGLNDADRLQAFHTAAREAPGLLVVDDDRVAAWVQTASIDPTHTLLGPALKLPVPSFDDDGRRRLATALRALTNLRGAPLSAVAEARQRLVFELPEHATDDDVATLGAEATGPEGLVRRGAALEKRQRSEEVIALLADLARTTPPTPASCEAALLVGKSERKLRHYGPARAALAVASQEACGDVRKRARYLETRVAVISRQKGGEALAEAFIKDYGDDRLVDDVQLWLAEARSHRSDRAGEVSMLEAIIQTAPDGDMAGEARFRLALRLAEAGKVDDARALLATAITAAETPDARGRVNLVDADRARYWQARLLAAPALDSVAGHPDAASRAAGVKALVECARSRPTTFYGRLAATLATSLDPAVVVGPSLLTRKALPPNAVVVVPEALADTPAFVAAAQAAEQGFDDDAVVLALGLLPRTDLESTRAIAAVAHQVGRLDISHQVFRGSGFAVVPGAPTDVDQLITWSLAWPLAYADAIAPAATRFKVPPPMMQGLAREESTFDAAVVSWAGAVGLCQLMPPTAADEARQNKLPKPTIEALQDPALNATLGASHLGRRLRSMGNPFMAIAAYNAGPGAVRRWLSPTISLPADTFVEGIGFDETRNYVKKVVSSWATYAVLDGDGAPNLPLTVPAQHK